jgi:hypothetical protein
MNWFKRLYKYYREVLHEVHELDKEHLDDLFDKIQSSGHYDPRERKLLPKGYYYWDDIKNKRKKEDTDDEC